jgi:hypothetical protein
MDSFLFGDSADEGQKRYIFALFFIEVALLKEKFGIFMVSWGFCLEDTGPFVFSDAVGEGEGVRVLPKNSCNVGFS